MIAAAMLARLRASLEPIPRGLKLAEVERDDAGEMIGFGEERRIAASVRQRDRLLDEICRPRKFART